MNKVWLVTGSASGLGQNIAEAVLESGDRLATHFLCRTLPKVSAEMSLHVLAYNLKRVMRIMGTGALMEALRA